METNKISFTMTVDDFIFGMKLKNKLLRKYASPNNVVVYLIMALIFVAFVGINVYFNNTLSLIIFIALFFTSVILKYSTQSKAFSQMYYQNKIISSLQTIYTDENGFYNINGYEKNFTKFNKIFYIFDNDVKLTIFTSLSKGMIVLNKNGENQNEIANLTSILQQKCQNVYHKAGGNKNA